MTTHCEANGAERSDWSDIGHDLSDWTAPHLAPLASHGMAGCWRLMILVVSSQSPRYGSVHIESFGAVDAQNFRVFTLFPLNGTDHTTEINIFTASHYNIICPRIIMYSDIIILVLCHK